MNQQLSNVPTGRIISIDALRGFDMFWIIGGDIFFRSFFKLFNTPFTDFLSEQLDHTAWNGFTFYDLIFPLFLFIVGVSMPFALGKRLEKGEEKKSIYTHIIKRAVILFVLGMLYNGLLDLDFANLRYTGVLHRIALCYLVVAIIYINTSFKLQIIISSAILLLYWAAMTLIPVPGMGAGILTPEANLAGYIDRLLLPGSFCCYCFGDNEGLISHFPAFSTTFLGVFTGNLLRSNYSQMKKVVWMLAGSVILVVLGLLWNIVFPINKLFWSSSYVLFTGGLSVLLMAVFYWIIDVKGCKKWSFVFVVIGLNPITIYVLSALFDFAIIANIFIHGFVNHLGMFSDVFSLLCVLIVKWLFLYFLYKQKIFLKA